MTDKQIPQTWRNGRIAVASIYFAAALILLGGVLICLGAIGSLMPFRFGNLGQAFMLAVLGIGLIPSGLGVWKMGVRASRNKAVLQADGVHFFYGPKETDHIDWQDITRVTHKGGEIGIHNSQGPLIAFDGYSFFLPSRLGKAIAARAGKSFEPLEKAAAASAASSEAS